MNEEMLGELHAEEERVEGGKTFAVFYYRGRRRDDGARLSLEVCKEERQWTQAGTQEVQTSYQEILIHHKDGQTLEQVIQKCCGFSMHGHMRKIHLNEVLSNLMHHDPALSWTWTS